MASLLGRIPLLGRLLPTPPRVFSNPNFEKISPAVKIEEETFSDYLAARYYPVRIGDVFNSQYQVVGKLGYGAYSTVWLGRDLKYEVEFLSYGQLPNDYLPTPCLTCTVNTATLP